MKKTYLYAGISIFFWSTIATLSKLLLDSLNSYQVLMYSAFFAAVSLFVVNLVRGKLRLLKNYTAKDYVIILLTCMPGAFLYYVFFYSGTARLAASQAFIINYLWPIMSVVFACILLKEKLTARKWIAFGLSFLGVITVAGKELFRFDANSLIGVVLCILAAVSYGAFTALNRKWEYDDQISMMISFFASAILSLIINLLMRTEFHVELPQILGFAWNGILAMALATVTWALALKGGDTAKISNLAYITPFLALVWTFLILKEPIAPLSIAGLVLIIVGILIQVKDKSKEKNN